VGGQAWKPQIHYIDWQPPANNFLHYTPQFTLTSAEAEKRADLVLFVNGIPLAVIECKAHTRQNGLKEARKQLLAYQWYVPQLFYYAQLLIAALSRA
jgi:type I restriction enzyme R subunit